MKGKTHDKQTGRLAGFHVEQYKTILIDPPWQECGGGKIKRGADRHYSVLSLDRIVSAIFTSGEFRPDFEGCHLWLWVTNNKLKDGLELMRTLGFRYVSNVCWVKMRNGNIQKGLGQYFYGSHELLLFGTIGKTIKPRAKDRQPTVLIGERTAHSRKPKEQYNLIECVSQAPRLEMFSRGSARAGWDTWGDEAKC